MILSTLLLISACKRPSDEQRIRAALEDMQLAMESAKPRDFMQYIGEDFTGADGQLDRQALHNLLRAQVLANARIGVTLASTDVELQGNHATVKVTATLSGGSGRWIPERGAIYRIESGWRKQDGEWICVNAQWERAL
ncbi:MAG TPA: nuclear transport factor 2 family protein [Dokdonella sp.]|uniref:nuclear transport factor 2 family protein n=1 Tax=Dokdonella sp. TaxID=2291710 RepID=UPI002D7FB026|nr:nuclear transport factor 2 family protein [Dokdonella sp.]HET9032753.1 nuclear transport factor 2 family protein [Dokdonella sp.]